jgi:glutaminase
MDQKMSRMFKQKDVSLFHHHHYHHHHHQPRQEQCETETYLQEYLNKKKEEITNKFKQFDKKNMNYILIEDFYHQLTELGLNCEHKHIKMHVEKMANNGRIEFLEFTKIMTGKPNIIQRALNNELAIPNFAQFCSDIKQIFEETRKYVQGDVPSYIPELANVNPDWFGISLCTIDGQTFSYGDSDVLFSLQAAVLPLTYCLACKQRNLENVHEFIGKEPSGAPFNAFTLNAENKPHNPMINTGGIVVCSLLEPKDDPSARFGNLYNIACEMAGSNNITFHQRMYLSEKSHGERNYALAYYMRGAGVKGLRGANISDVLDFYFQACSLQCSARDLSIIAATLASGGLCPVTRRKVLSIDIVKNCLSLLYSCGMYDYSGQWAFQVGLPSKSGISGCIMVVIPNVMGIAIYSPRIDKRGNSVRGIEFCKSLTTKFNLSIFDELLGLHSKPDPTIAPQ